jgi:hypothetical protein
MQDARLEDELAGGSAYRSREENATRLRAEERAIAVRVLRARYDDAVRDLAKAKERVETIKDALTELGAAP